ncbi:hypothetical protein ABIB66_008693 [Bradyrhizobium sp. F1.13.3]
METVVNSLRSVAEEGLTINTPPSMRSDWRRTHELCYAIGASALISDTGMGSRFLRLGLDAVNEDSGSRNTSPLRPSGSPVAGLTPAAPRHSLFGFQQALRGTHASVGASDGLLAPKTELLVGHCLGQLNS